MFSRQNKYILIYQSPKTLGRHSKHRIFSCYAYILLLLPFKIHISVKILTPPDLT